MAESVKRRVAAARLAVAFVAAGTIAGATPGPRRARPPDRAIERCSSPNQTQGEARQPQHRRRLAALPGLQNRSGPVLQDVHEAQTRATRNSRKPSTHFTKSSVNGDLNTSKASSAATSNWRRRRPLHQDERRHHGRRLGLHGDQALAATGSSACSTFPAWSASRRDRDQQCRITNTSNDLTHTSCATGRGRRRGDLKPARASCDATRPGHPDHAADRRRRPRS